MVELDRFWTSVGPLSVKLVIITVILLQFSASSTMAQTTETNRSGETNAPTESGNKSAFINLKGTEVILRKGPGTNYPKILLYTAQHAPLQVISRLDNWVKVMDWHNNSGWVHNNLITSTRTAIVISDLAPLLIAPLADTRQIASLTRNVIVKIHRCLGNWCQVSTVDSSKSWHGWTIKARLWGAIHEG